MAHCMHFLCALKGEKWKNIKYNYGDCYISVQMDLTFFFHNAEHYLKVGIIMTRYYLKGTRF
jgi:hypothetical protein